VPLVIMAIVMGIYPKPFLEMIEQPVDAIVARVRPEYFDDTGITPPPLPASPASPGAAVAADTSGRPGGGSLAELLERQQLLGALIDAR